MSLQDKKDPHRLTPREEAIWTAITKQVKSGKEIARALGISTRTVAFHRANIRAKLRARAEKTR